MRSSSAEDRPEPPSAGCWRRGDTPSSSSTAHRRAREASRNRSRPARESCSRKSACSMTWNARAFCAAAATPSGGRRPIRGSKRSGPRPGALGYQVFRPDFDRVLLDSAAPRPARWCARKPACDPSTLGDGEAVVDYEQDGRRVDDRRPPRARLLRPRRRGRAALPPRATGPPDVRAGRCLGTPERWGFPDETHTRSRRSRTAGPGRCRFLRRRDTSA